MSAETETTIKEVIFSAEEVHDPLDTLVEKAKTDLGAPFAPDILARLLVMKKENRAGFETLRAQLKKAGVRIAELDKAITESGGEVDEYEPTKQADVLIVIADEALLFHTPDGIGYADLTVNGHRETWPIRSKGFKRWLSRQFYEETKSAPNSEAMQSALNVIEAKAHFDAPEYKVHIRVAGLDGKIYLDLADDAWRALEIAPDGWRVIEEPPVRFRRSAGMLPLPVPERGGTIEALRPFLNVQGEDDFILVVAWLLAALRDRGAYPALVFSGEHGTAKSTFSAMLRALVDPNTSPIRALPREERDLFIAASNGHVLAFDNVSGLPAWISDALCRLATGGGFATRQLHTDQDEVLFDAARPIILNGIEDIVTRPDLADRSLPLTLQPIPEEKRKPEKELWAEFEKERPRIMGAILNAVACGLRMLPHTRLDKLPRMADFALWATACETAMWEEGTFIAAYTSNRNEAIENVTDADPVASSVCALMMGQAEWTGTATDLLGALATIAGETIRKSKTWPDTPKVLSGRLRRAAPFLRKLGVEIDFRKEGKARTRTIYIFSKAENLGKVPSAASADNEPLHTNEIATDDSNAAIVPNNSLDHIDVNGADKADAKNLPLSIKHAAVCGGTADKDTSLWEEEI